MHTTLLPTNPQPPSRLRRYFLTGVLVTAPVGLTLYLAWAFINWMDRLVTPLLPHQLNPNVYLPFQIPGVGLVAAFLTLTVVGALLSGFLGNWFTKVSEIFLSRVPVVKTIYTVIKQVLHTALADQSKAFREAVLVEFPRTGSWTLGFVTSRQHGVVNTAMGQTMVSVLIPTTPTLTSGYVIFVSESDVRSVDMPPEQALKLIISGGLIS